MYIRTKDGVYVLSEAYWAGNKDEILAQSEKLEELCDEFVLINNNVFTIPQIITHTNFQNTKAYREDYGKFETIYGAIWTDKGLIYVAKMDNEGKLELI